MNQVLKQVSDATGTPVNTLMQYGLILGVMMVMFGVGSSYITNLLGVAYPAFMSFMALETDELDDDKQWLTYWVCFGAFNIIDQFAGIILRFIPFYYFLKLGFLVYLFHPSTLGATTVYNKVILPRVQQYESHIEEFEKQASDAMNQAREKVGGFTKKDK